MSSDDDDSNLDIPSSSIPNMTKKKIYTTEKPLEIGRDDWDPFSGILGNPASSGMKLGGILPNSQHGRSKIEGLPSNAIPPGARFDVISPIGVQRERQETGIEHPFLRVKREPNSTRFVYIFFNIFSGDPDNDELLPPTQGPSGSKSRPNFGFDLHRGGGPPFI